jgi:hypothetical protein
MSLGAFPYSRPPAAGGGINAGRAAAGGRRAGRARLQTPWAVGSSG